MIHKIKTYRTYIYSFICCSLFTMSCTSNEDLLKGGGDAIVLQCDKSLSWVGSRTVIDDNGTGSFSDGDFIELMVASDGANRFFQPEYAAGQWTPSLKRSDFSSGILRFSAVYPLLSSLNETERAIALPSDQTTKENHTSADILYASAAADDSDSSVLLQFGHALHRICINLEGNVPEDLQIELYSQTDGKISLEDGNVSLSDNVSRTWIKPYKKDRQTYTAIILPQDATCYHAGEGFIRFTIGDKIVSYFLDKSISSFEQGKQTVINLNLKSSETGEVDTDFCNQTLWVYGVKSPDFPGKENLYSAAVGKKEFEDGLWFRYANEKMNPPMLLEEEFLTWKDDFGWFDCNKTFEYEGDFNMCWAAAASNLIHWWLAQNEKYIEAYDERYGLEYDDITRPQNYSKMTEENQQHSEVFNFFKLCFDDLGSWDTGAVNWFVNGDRKNLIYCKKTNFQGFFRKVFSKDDEVAKGTSNTRKDNFNLWIKDAFRNNQAIGFSAYDFAGPDTKSHSMVIWGVEFDAEGNVAFVYFCDNNSALDEPNHASLKRFKVVYDKTDIPEMKGDYAYLSALDNIDGTPSKARYRFTSLTLVDLRRDIWQKAFPEVK